MTFPQLPDAEQALVTFLTANTALAALHGGRVVSVAVRLAALWSPADDTGRPRYRTDIALTVMP